MAERRERTAAEFRRQQTETQARLDGLEQQVVEARAAAQREQEAAEAEARRVVTDAEERAAAVIQEARATADRIRAESDRELAAASQRRDSINAQLTNVRQMLATLSGTNAGPTIDPVSAADEPSTEIEAQPVEADRDPSSLEAPPEDAPEDREEDSAGG